MQMKEICEKTGLTDRAVRLYIENGLLSPAVESNYAGRRSIRFTEEDVEILSAIAALRRAEFSLSAIREMQTDPARIPAIIAEHRQNLQESVDSKLRTLRRLEDLDPTVPLQYTDVANLLCETVAPESIPKEDSSMRLKDLHTLIRRRVPSVIGFALLLIGTVLFAPLPFKAAFAEPLILVGGGYELHYKISTEALLANWLLLLLPLFLIGGVILLFLHIFSGKRGLILSAGILCVLCLIGMVCLPETMRQELYFYEFLACRYSFLMPLLPGNMAVEEWFTTSLKYIPPIGALICCVIGYLTHRKEQE